MAFSKPLSLILFFVISLAGAATMEERYEDLVHSSLQSVVALNEVVSNLAVQLSQVSTSLLDVRLTLQQTESSVRSLEKRIEDKDIERNISVKSLEQDIVDLRAEKDDAIANLTSALAVTRGKIEVMEMEKWESEVMIVSGEQSAGGERCIKVCAGSTGRSTTTWQYYSTDGIFEDVDISDCGFTKIPTVTTSIEGSSSHWTAKGTSSIYSVSTTSFRIYLNTNHNMDFADSAQWNVEWIAVGYTC